MCAAKKGRHLSDDTLESGLEPLDGVITADLVGTTD